MNPMSRFDGLLKRAEGFLSSIAALMLLLIMLVVVVDVAMRYFLHAPLTWSYDLVSMYLMVGVFFLALSDTLANDEHVCVDILHKCMPRRLRHFTEALGYACAIVVFAAIVWMSATRTIASFAAGEVSAGVIPWPMWLSIVAAPIGAGLMLLRMVFRLIGHIASAAAGASVIELPTLVEH
jgi:TRAP-type C4-dicarboxylate transport system permease small subunit